MEENPVSPADVDVLLASVDALSAEIRALQHVVEGALFARMYSSTDTQNPAVEPQSVSNLGQSAVAPGAMPGSGSAECVTQQELTVLERSSDMCVYRLWSGG